MARDYYDWRGIAMLTQQLGQLFEPSKARLMSQQQEHEMNMLMAKKSWDVESEQLEQLKKEYDGVVKEFGAQKTAVEELGLIDLALAGSRDGAIPVQSASIYEKNDIKKLSDLQALSLKYEDMIANTEEKLDNMKLYNTTAKIGDEWRKGTMTKKDRKGVMVDYYKEANVDGIPELSYDEGQNMIKRYIKDTYEVGEGEEGMEITFGSGTETESFMVRPEAIAFRAGFESNIGTGTGRGKAEKDLLAGTPTGGGKTFLKMSDEELFESARYNRQIYSDIDKNSGQNYPLGIILDMVDGEFVGTKAAQAAGYKQDAVINYSTSYTNYRNATKEILRRGLKLPDVISSGSFKGDVMSDFNNYGTHPDSLLTQISTSDKDDAEFILNSYNDFLIKLPGMKPVDRREGIAAFQEWLQAK